MKYAVAVLSFFENENRVSIVDANSEVEAMIKALSSGDKMLDEDYVQWSKPMLTKTVEEIQEECFDGDMAISKPVIIEM
ncbi:hypothetical protein [Acetobacterium wieringae]|uniref:hypothetical protein n=1 Tax=Acetobacterium wieringae TaxID=52694 RepID=UPI0026EB0512|nr:hypothetical protein [Acetobacterium wieringae]